MSASPDSCLQQLLLNYSSPNTVGTNQNLENGNSSREKVHMKWKTPRQAHEQDDRERSHRTPGRAPGDDSA